jgi:hypothetical protein
MLCLKCNLLLLNNVKIDVRYFGFVAVEYLGNLLQGRAACLHEKEEDKYNFKADPTLYPVSDTMMWKMRRELTQ